MDSTSAPAEYSENYHLQNLDTQSFETWSIASSKKTQAPTSEECSVIEIVSLGVVIVIVGFLLTVPIIFYHIPVNVEEEESVSF